MTTPEDATRAPESDAQEDRAAPPSSSVDASGPTPAMGDCCTSDRPTPSGKASTGEIVKINDVESDKFASEGFVVIMPDLFGGDPAPNAAGLENELDLSSTSFLDIFKVRAAETAKSFMIDMWLARHTQDKVMPLLHRVIDGCKEKYSAVVAEGQGIYAAGYCFGARYVLLLAKENQSLYGEAMPNEEAGGLRKGPLIKAGALAHPTSVSHADFDSLKAPLSFICVENDPLFPDEIRAIGEDTMEKASLEHEVKVYPGVPHGKSFTIPTLCA
ncbi:Protein AIM2 [Ceratocystis lukuohia]|uniref:Protein AIM2 n=1 Tax=Ceratocystis lukuohia TaxID=2019550 RepID=A0ABR4MAS9_9PEZI